MNCRPFIVFLKPFFFRESGADVAVEHRKSKRRSAFCVSGIGKFLESLIIKNSLAARRARVFNRFDHIIRLHEPGRLSGRPSAVDVGDVSWVAPYWLCRVPRSLCCLAPLSHSATSSWISGVT